jgi:parallel beta-helix repeat protein
LPQTVRAVRRPSPPTIVVTALLSALFVFAFTAVSLPGTADASVAKEAACGVNLRTSPYTTAKVKVTIKTGTKVTVATSVTGGSWRATCAGKTLSSRYWYRISAVNGKSVKSLYGVTYVYGARGLFRPVASTAFTRYAACNLYLRTSPSTSASSKALVPINTKVLVATAVTGTKWSATCAGNPTAGTAWYRITSVNGSSVSSLYGVSAVYAAAGLFKTSVTPTPTPTPTPPTANCGTSIQARVDAAAAGSTVTVPACIYRETVTINKPLTLVAQPGAEIRGSTVWTSWTQSGSTWVSASTVPTFYNPGWTCTPGGDGRCAWPEQVFVDGSPLYQVSSTSTPSAGQFKLDGSRRVVMGQNPSGHTVEVTTRDTWLIILSSDVTIDGFRMRHASSWAQGGGINVGGYWVGAVNRVTIKNSTLSDSHGRIVSIAGGTGHQILNNDISGAGCVGIGGSGGSNWRIQGNRVHGNATEGFDVGIESGGMKILFVDGLLVDGNEVDHNSRGIWTDTGVRNATFSNNRVHDNAYNGLFLESSHYLTVTGNEVWGNSWGPNGNVWAWGGGITLASSDHAEVDHNVVAWNADGITVVSQQRTDDAPHVEINIHDNTIAMNPGTDSAAYASGWVMDWSGILFSASSNNRGSNNRYWYPMVENSQNRYAWNGSKTRLTDYEATPAEAGATYLTTSQKDSVLSAVGIPMTP